MVTSTCVTKQPTNRRNSRQK